MVLFSTLILALACITGSIKLHNSVLSSCLRWPASVFDVSPIGRVLNRFSNDVNVVDNTLPTLMQTSLMMLFTVKIQSSKFCLRVGIC